MSTVLVNFRIDEATKKDMESVCTELGITMSAAFNIFAKKVAREKRIPFELSTVPSCAGSDNPQETTDGASHGK